jgi:hypothetical protein
LATILAFWIGLSLTAWGSPVPVASAERSSHAFATASEWAVERPLPRHSSTDFAGAIWLQDQDLRTILSGDLPARQLPAVPADPAKERKIKPLPDPPGSASLFLCAVGTIGAWQVSRSARRLNLAEVPAWLHTGGPDQIGHAVRLDPLDVRLQPAAELCLLPVMNGLTLPRTWCRLPEVRGRCQGFLTITAARGPPGVEGRTDDLRPGRPLP